MEDSKLSSSPSAKPNKTTIQFNGIIFANAKVLADSYTEAVRKTAAFTVSKQMNDVIEMISLPVLKKKDNWTAWVEAITSLVSVTSSASIFTRDSAHLNACDMTPTQLIWNHWWKKTLLTADSTLSLPENVSSRAMLKAIVNNDVNKAISSG